MPSSCSPSALLKLVGIIFVLFFCLTPGYQYLPEDSFTGVWYPSSYIWCPGALAQGAGFRLGTHLEAYRGVSREHGPVDTIFVLSACLEACSMSQKAAYMLIWSPEFCDCCLGNTSRSPSSGGQQSLHLQSYRTVHICTL